MPHSPRQLDRDLFTLRHVEDTKGVSLVVVVRVSTLSDGPVPNVVPLIDTQEGVAVVVAAHKLEIEGVQPRVRSGENARDVVVAVADVGDDVVELDRLSCLDEDVDVGVVVQVC